MQFTCRKCQRLMFERNERTENINNFIWGNLILRTNCIADKAQQNVKISSSMCRFHMSVINTVIVHRGFLPLLNSALEHSSYSLRDVSCHHLVPARILTTLSLPFRSGCRATLLSEDSISQLLQSIGRPHTEATVIIIFANLTCNDAIAKNALAGRW